MECLNDFFCSDVSILILSYYGFTVTWKDLPKFLERNSEGFGNIHLFDIVSFYEKAIPPRQQVDLREIMDLVKEAGDQRICNLQCFANICVLGCYVESVDMFTMMSFFCLAFLESNGNVRNSENVPNKDRCLTIPDTLLTDPSWLFFCFGDLLCKRAHFPLLYDKALFRSRTSYFPLNLKQSIVELLGLEELYQWNDESWLLQLKPMSAMWKNAFKKFVAKL